MTTFHEATKSILLSDRFASVKGVLVNGVSVSYLISELRGLGWKNVSEDSFERHGFKIVPGFACKSTRNGPQYVAPARVVILP